MATKKLQIGTQLNDIEVDTTHVHHGNETLNNIIDELRSSAGGSGGDSMPFNLLPIKLTILGDSIASYAQGIWEGVLGPLYNVNIIANYAVGKASYHHRKKEGYRGTLYNLSTEGITNDLPDVRSSDNVVTNQVNRLVYALNNGAEKPDVVIIHAGINDRNELDTSKDNYLPTISSTLNDVEISSTLANGLITNEFLSGSITSQLVKPKIWELYGDPDEFFQPWFTSNVRSQLTALGKVEGTHYTTNGNGYLCDLNGNLANWAFANQLGLIKAYDTDGDMDARLKTMAGGLKFAVETLWMNYPEIKVIVTTPIYTAGGSTYNVRHINEVIKKTASYLSVPVIDLTYESQITPNKYAFMSDDGLHPSLRGAMYMAECIGAGLVRHFGFVSPIPKKDRLLRIVVKNSSNQPVNNYNVTLCLVGIEAFQDHVYSETHEYVRTTNSNGVLEMMLPAWKYKVVHIRTAGGTSYVTTIANEIDLLNNQAIEVTHNTQNDK